MSTTMQSPPHCSAPEYSREYAEAEERIYKHRTIFDQMVESAEGFFHQRDFATAAVYAQAAAKYAYSNHAAVWSSVQLEMLMAKVGEATRRGKIVRHPKGGRGVLHVLTTAYALGGHTRSVWRWIRKDNMRSHSVALTRQAGLPVPRHLAEAVDMAAGQMHFLDAIRGGLPARANALREIAACYDIVVLHIHPFDVVPLIAFAADTERPPVVFVNHADHTFWLGVCISDVLLHLRESGIPVSMNCRGVEAQRCRVLPVPLTPLTRTMSRTEAKKALGISAETILLFSVASSYKYEPVLAETGFVRAVLPVLQANRHAMLLVVGPEHRGQWEEGNRATDGRIRAYGARGDIATFYQAADIYLDPFPFASTTSFLEGGSYGLPLVSYSPFDNEAAIFGADSPELNELMVKSRDLSTYQRRLSELINDAAVRTHIGETTSRAIFEAHSGEAWNIRVEQIYDAAARASHARQSVHELNDRSIGALDVRLACISHNAGLTRQTEDILLEDVGVLPLKRRLSACLNRSNLQMSSLARLLLSEWAKNRLRTWKNGKRKLSDEVVVA